MDGTNVSIGYSIPSIRPSPVVACGQGYIPQVSLKCLMVNHAILLAFSHGVASGRYSVWIRMPCQLEASQRKSGEAAQAKSRTVDAGTCQGLVPASRGGARARSERADTRRARLWAPGRLAHPGAVPPVLEKFAPGSSGPRARAS